MTILNTSARLIAHQNVTGFLDLLFFSILDRLKLKFLEDFLRKVLGNFRRNLRKIE